MTPSTPTADHLTHFDATGQAHMVDVGAKQDSHRIAVAAGTIRMQPTTLALITSGSAKNVQVTNVPGAGGTVGLAQFVNAKGDPNQLLVNGFVMVGAILTNKSPVSLDQTTPIARLTAEPLAIVVIGGLVSSTALTLVLVPVLYRLVEGRKEKKELMRQLKERPDFSPAEDDVDAEFADWTTGMVPKLSGRRAAPGSPE